VRFILYADRVQAGEIAASPWRRGFSPLSYILVAKKNNLTFLLVLRETGGFSVSRLFFGRKSEGLIPYNT
jgi:hypothetical protein